MKKAPQKNTHGGVRPGQGRPASDWVKLGIKLPPNVIDYLETVPAGGKSKAIADAIIASAEYRAFIARARVTCQVLSAGLDYNFSE